ncbi:MAG: diguanylate cyclase domain-containing protein [Candidatus Limnocylindrales bacterium]
MPLAVEPALSSPVERRLEEIAGVIEELALLRFNARAPLGPDGDIVDAVAAGVNFLGEELEASFSEIERRVADRTAALVTATQELTRRALHDELTGLPNRALFWELLGHRLALAGRRQANFAVLFLDVDDFKEVNDTLGHAAGDLLLIEVAARLSAALRTGDMAARVGGDEFVVLLDEVATKAAALSAAERLSATLGAPYELGTDRWIATACIGVAMGPAGFRTADAVVAAADAAMYDAKEHGSGRYAIFSEDLHWRDGRPRAEPPD